MVVHRGTAGEERADLPYVTGYEPALLVGKDGTLDPARLARWRKLAAEDAHNSASLAELCALLSAVAEVPLSQSIALTGKQTDPRVVESLRQLVPHLLDAGRRVILDGATLELTPGRCNLLLVEIFVFGDQNPILLVGQGQNRGVRFATQTLHDK